MAFPITDRIKRWYEGHEIHFAVARPGGQVRVGIAPQAQVVSEDQLALHLPLAVWETVRPFLAENAWVALHPGGLGAVKAPYQLKGLARPVGDSGDDSEVLGDHVRLLIDLKELYITKPGPEAGQRVDQWSRDELTEFERRLGWLEEENL